MTLWTPYNERKNPELTNRVEFGEGRVLVAFAPFKPVPDYVEGLAYREIGRKNPLRVLATYDDTPNHGRLLHVSLSYADRDPSWRDIKQIREAFFSPQVDVMMVLPQERDYVNLHPHTFHLWQTPTEWGLQ